VSYCFIAYGENINPILCVLPYKNVDSYHDSCLYPCRARRHRIRRYVVHVWTRIFAFPACFLCHL